MLREFSNQRLKILVFNVENLFIHLDHYLGQDFSAINEKQWQTFSSSTVPNKPLLHVQLIAESIKASQADIVMLCEVGGRESLLNFSKYFLADSFAPYIIEGNSDRGIDIAYLVRRDLHVACDLISHKNRSIDFLYEHEKLSKDAGYGHLPSAKITSHKFSRDVLELRVFAKTVVPEVTNEGPLLILLLTHLKSPLDRQRIDPGGRDRRRAELEKLVLIYQETVQEFSGQVPVLLGGDFNGRAALPEPEEEFQALYRETSLQDCLQIAEVPSEERFTHQLFSQRSRGTKSPGLNRQIDYLFVPKELAPHVCRKETRVFRFVDLVGMPMLIPRNINEKRLLPSDHFPVLLTLLPASMHEGIS